MFGKPKPTITIGSPLVVHNRPNLLQNAGQLTNTRKPGKILYFGN